MAKKFLTGLTLVNLDSDPLTGSEGELYFNTSASVAKIYKAGAWTELGAAGGITVGAVEPENPEVGDSWFNNENGSYYIFDGTYWVEVNSIIDLLFKVSETPPEEEVTGLGWFNQENSSFYIFDGTYWVEVSTVITSTPLSQEEIQDYVAPLLNHSNHTNISASYDDFNNQILLSASASFTTEEIQDSIAPLFDHNNHSNISVVYDDESNEIIFSTSASVTSEQIQDSIAPLFEHANHTNISAIYDDLNNQILLSASASSGAGITISTTAPENPEVGSGWYNNETGVFAVYDGTYWVDVNGVITITDEQLQDAVAPMFEHNDHTNITATYNDSTGKIILSAGAGYTDEEALDAVAAALASASSTSINVTYDDNSGQILLEVGEVGSGITISTTAPESPNTGDGWFNNETKSFYLYDGSYWVEVNGVVSIEDEQLQDSIAPLFIHNNHTNVVATYDDINNEIILNTSASITNIDSIVYPDYITFDTTPETSSATTGTIFWDSGDGLVKAVLNANVQLGIGQESVALVKNSTGSSIAKGKVVYINGAQGQRPTIALASSASESTSSKTFGIVAETIADGAEGFVVTEGILRGVNTDGLTQGGALWLSSSGNYTQTMPTQPNHGVFLGYVVKAHASSGEIFVKIQNGYELNELHNVLISASVQNNDLLAYESSSGLWKNKPSSDIIEVIHPFLLMGG